jgi:hypothetical protein
MVKEAEEEACVVEEWAVAVACMEVEWVVAEECVVAECAEGEWVVAGIMEEMAIREMLICRELQRQLYN